MLLALLLMSMLGAPQATAIGRPLPTHADAAALAGDGQYEAALEAFRRLAAADPGDHDARLWIARLHGWMGRPELAEPVYRSIMVEDPSNLEATLGAGMTLVTLWRMDEAIETLERAESREPQNADVLAGLGLAHTLAGRTTRAVSYAERAVAIAPTAAHRQTLEQARLVHGHRVELTSFGERYDTPTSDTGSVDLRVNYRFREDLRLLARGQHQRKFGFSEQRGGAGLEWRWRPTTSLAGHVLVGPDTVVLPRVDVNAEIVHQAGDALWTAGYRFFDFPSAQVSVVSPGVTWWPSVRASLGLRYDLSLTDSPAVASAVDGHSLSLRGSYRVVPRIWVNAGYTRGTDNFETLSPDRVGDFRANTASAGLRFDLPSLTSVFGVYEHQWRPNTVQMGRLTISLMQRF